VPDRELTTFLPPAKTGVLELAARPVRRNLATLITASSLQRAGSVSLKICAPNHDFQIHAQLSCPTPIIDDQRETPIKAIYDENAEKFALSDTPTFRRSMAASDRVQRGSN
jgi:hypothetical protein